MEFSIDGGRTWITAQVQGVRPRSQSAMGDSFWTRRGTRSV
jgi:hypothetical protein